MSGNNVSVWSESAGRSSFPSLDKNMSTDVLIAGGGIAGILCAYMLKEAGVDCILAESGSICGGITKNTTAKITISHGLIYSKIAKKMGEDKAKLYFEAQKSALEKYAELCRHIPCDFEIKDMYVYSLKDSQRITDEVTALGNIGADAETVTKTELPFEIKAALRIKDQAQFHPLKFLYGLAEGLPIYENTKILELMPNKAVTNKGEIRFKKLIIATHFPIINKHGAYFLKLYQHRSYVIALRGADNISGMYVDESDKGLSFRSFGDYLLLGGGAHRTGKKGGSFTELFDFANKYYKGAEAVAKWATQDCMTLDGIPYIGQYSKRTPDVYVATGFNKWGMTNAMAAANILCDLVRGRENPYSEVFFPCRNIFHPQLAVNAFESTVGLLTPTVPRCPHLGCALKYNRAEHTWDCPCHGSRFTKNGELIDNPATDDKQI